MSKSELYELLAYLDLEQYEKVVSEIEKKDKEIERLNKIIEYLVDNSDEATNLYEDYLIKEKRNDNE